MRTRKGVRKGVRKSERKGRRINLDKSSKIFSIPGIDKDIKAEIDITAIRNNIDYLKNKTKTEIMPVLKGDAYGHGLIEISRILRKFKTKYIGVATVGEAILLRDSGDKGRILAWLYDIDSQELYNAFRMNIDIAIFDETHISKIEKMVPRNKKVKITVFVDTGINRAGIPYEKAYDAAIKINRIKKFELVGLMSHFIESEVKDSKITYEQLRKFRALRARLKDIGIDPPQVHIANTDGCLNYDVSDFTISRPGKGIYGISNNNSAGKFLKLSTTVKSYIIQLKHVNKGDGIGYNWKYIAPRRMRIAILPIGYADIIPRLASLKMFVYANGTKRRVLGLISMDQIVIEARETDKINNDVYIFGNGINCPQMVYDIAKLAKTIPLEILCHMGYRVNRTYLKY